MKRESRPGVLRNNESIREKRIRDRVLRWVC